ncbi:TnsD family Tn7-like transposition protein [Curvibacter sp. APW13]|uniref:TnsD family Tn7-like transposition protein n=1 Tax=Curvibacter sp. APW13 TaxID=3077236 RepID=UPI0028DD40FB|nr:TnsD family Tn7-like transposition protein [Curvibacter sp. APW13]MDT8992683.1 TnsD family Tn7-like transposition protein [Curvibacter sp. APW13]
MESLDLFDLPSPVLAFLPDETLFSWCSRQHAFWGFPNAGATAQILFGDRHFGTHHDLPSALDQLVARTKGEIGDAVSLALSRTLLRYYQPFVTPTLLADCIQMMRGQSARHLKFRLGLLTSRFRANHPLKACPACMTHELREFGWAYWHLEHQYPGAWFCTHHQIPLLVATVKSTGVHRFQWALPHGKCLSQRWLADVVDVHAIQKLTCMTTDLVRESRPVGWLGGANVQPVLRQAVRARGWLTSKGNLRSKDLAVDFWAYSQRLRGSPDLDSSLPSGIRDAGTQACRMLRPWRTGTHPLRTLILVDWLFETPEAFITEYDRLHSASLPSEGSEDKNEAVRVPNPPVQDPRKNELLRKVQSGMSATAAAESVGITVGTAISWLSQANISVKRRPKSLSHEIQAALKKDLNRGIDKATCAATHSITVQAVTRFLRSEPGLHDAWKNASYSLKLHEARARWLEVSRKFGHLGVKLTRAHAPSSYAWLYRHDGVWLQSHTPPVVVRTGGGLRIRWDERDLELSAALEPVIEALRSQHGDRPLHLWQIYQALPKLKPKLSKLDRLPLTKSIVERALGKHKLKTGEGLL